ncbi:hypothetical protein [Nostoc sp.]|uniref:hypothetical protein n=1 Tax=Nostoc sp. TaxID=1180 RepID=UPI002FF75755
MPRQKRTSRVIEKAEFRFAGFKAIDPNMNFDDYCNLESLAQSIEQLHTTIDAYNAALAVVDSSKTKIDEMEKNLSKLSDKMLKGVAFKYGTDSSEYEIAGGVRDSDRIRKSRLTRLKTSAGLASDRNAKTA